MIQRTLILFAASSGLLAADVIDIRATFDSTLDFWSGVVGSNQLDNGQMWAGNSGIAPSASEERLNSRFFERFGAFMRFDLASLTEEMVQEPGFNAMLDVMFHGFAADRNVFEGAGAVTPPEFMHHAGNGLTDLVVHAFLTDHAPSANRWLSNSVGGSLLNWDNTVPTNLDQAVTIAGSFGPQHYEPQPRARATLVHGWSATPRVAGATQPNFYRQLTWDITSLVRDWVLGTVPNYGLFIATDPETSYGEQVNFLTSESIERPPNVVNPGDAAPLLRIRTQAPVFPVANQWSTDERLGALFGLDYFTWAYSEALGFVEYTSFPWIFLPSGEWLFHAETSEDGSQSIFYSSLRGWVVAFRDQPGYLFVISSNDFIRV